MARGPDPAHQTLSDTYNFFSLNLADETDINCEFLSRASDRVV